MAGAEKERKTREMGEGYQKRRVVRMRDKERQKGKGGRDRRRERVRGSDRERENGKDGKSD